MVVNTVSKYRVSRVKVSMASESSIKVRWGWHWKASRLNAPRDTATNNLLKLVIKAIYRNNNAKMRKK